MSKIQIMSEDLSNKIAAGEVVEKVANVVKELVENSIDAESKNISVELIDSGLKEIKVIDDGYGMDDVDALKAFQRHATSKIKRVEDLFFINTLGFRGEALPSIASVSKVLMQTSDGKIGTLIEIHGGKLVKNEKSDLRRGTIIKINDLFYNTPARYKYLKSEQAELANTVSFLERLALSYPSISFTLKNNDNEVLRTTGSGNLLKTIHEVFGTSISKNMVEIKNSNDDYDLFGYVCKPQILKSNRNYMITIVNGRVVKNVELNRVINDAYHTYKPDIKYPVVVLEISTDPTLIDVNIHPTKQDIKFSKMDSLKDLVLNTIKDALYKALLIPNIEIKTKNEVNEIPIKKEYNTYNDDILMVNDDLIVQEEKEDIIQESFDFTSLEKNEEIKELELYPCGHVMGTYIVAQNDNNMYLIDQHAAQERVNYERVIKSLEEGKVNITPMLIPVSVELSPSDYLKYTEAKDRIISLGFEIEEFGLNTIVVKAHPTWLLEGYHDVDIRSLIEEILEYPKDFNVTRFRDRFAATVACKMSVKGNENITMEQAEEILKDLVKCDNPYNCPHGRPAIISFSRYEIEKMFKRVMN